MRQAWREQHISISFFLSLCFFLSIPHFPLCCHAWGCVNVCVLRDCVCATDVPIDADLFIKNSLSGPLWPLTTAFSAISWVTHPHICGLFPPLLNALVTSAYTLQRGSVQWSRHCIDKLINSILPSSCEEELNLFCLADLTEGCCECVLCVVLAYVCVCIFSLLCFNLKQFLTAVISRNTVCDI